MAWTSKDPTCWFCGKEVVTWDPTALNQGVLYMYSNSEWPQDGTAMTL